MEESNIESLTDITTALGLVITQIITTLTPSQAAQAATGLAVETQCAMQEGAGNTQIQILSNYLDLLRVVAQRG